MKKRNFFYIFLSVVLLLLSFSFIQNTLDIKKSNKRYETLKQEVGDLEKRKALLQEEIQYQQTDEYIEREARTKLNMIKENEEIYVLEDLDTASNITSDDASNSRLNNTNANEDVYTYENSNGMAFSQNDSPEVSPLNQWLALIF